MLRSALIALIRFYQVVISPRIPASCRFEPSCSHYAVGALERHGAVRGSLLAAKRLIRCHPWGGMGFDPVPPVEARHGGAAAVESRGSTGAREDDRMLEATGHR